MRSLNRTNIIFIVLIADCNPLNLLFWELNAPSASSRCCMTVAETCLRWRRQLRAHPRAEPRSPPEPSPDTPLSPERLGRCSLRPVSLSVRGAADIRTLGAQLLPSLSVLAPLSLSLPAPVLPSPPSRSPRSRRSGGIHLPRREDTPRAWMPSNPPAERSSRAPEFRGTHGGLPNTKVSEEKRSCH